MGLQLHAARTSAIQPALVLARDLTLSCYEEWVEGSAFTDDMIRSSWENQSPASKVHADTELLTILRLAAITIQNIKYARCRQLEQPRESPLPICRVSLAQKAAFRTFRMNRVEQVQGVLLTAYHPNTLNVPHRAFAPLPLSQTLVTVGLPQQPQQETKKSRFSLNFLRASLLSPKGSSAAKGGSIFSTAAQHKSSFQSTPEAKHTPLPHSASNSPSRQSSVDQSAASAEHWSPLGHAASALSVSQALPDEQGQETSSLKTAETPNGLQDQSPSPESRSPLRALSSNSPTRLRPQGKQAAADGVGCTSQPASLRASRPAADQPAQGIHHKDHADDASAATLILGAAPQQQSPLPSNALVAYSSDEDDWHNAVDATESRLPLYTCTSNLQVLQHPCPTSV